MTADRTEAQGWRPPDAGDVLAAAGVLGLAAFAVCYSYERAFYGTFGLEPENAGQGYAVIVARAASGALLVAALFGAAAVGPAAAVLLRHRFARWTRAAGRALSAAVAAAAGWSAAAVAFLAAGMDPSDAARVAVSFGALAAAFALAGPAVEGRPRNGRLRAGLAVVLLLLVVARAWDAGAADSRSLLRAGDARASASLWQQWLGLATPAATAVWTEPGADRPSTATVRIIGSDGGATVVFDLDACLLRRIPSGDLSTRSGVAGHSGRPGQALPTPVPRCPPRR